MVHIGDISHEKRLNHPSDALKVGEIVKAQVLEADKERRRLRLGIKQLVPTSIDEYIAEHKPGDGVSGRVVDVSATRAKVELGEGVMANCKLATAKTAEASASASKADISSLSEMLAQKWKSGPSTPSGPSAPVRTGEVRSFRITNLDAAQKRIELELA
jgi:small subunit ribosomal protein S1